MSEKTDKSFIKRGKRNGNFTVINNDIFNKKMSMQSVGLLCYILSLPEDWKIYKSELSEHFDNGRDSTSKAFNDLIKNGYIVKKQLTENGKFSGVQYTVYDEPVNASSPFTENPETENPETEKPAPENPTLQRTNETKDEQTKFVSSKEETRSRPVSEKNPFFTGAMKIYYDWFQSLNDEPPKIDAGDGSALKQIIAHLKSSARAKEPEISEEKLLANVLNGFGHIFKNWGVLDPFYRKQVKLTQINSNLTNIINEIKNGTKKAGGTARGFATNR